MLHSCLLAFLFFGLFVSYTAGNPFNPEPQPGPYDQAHQLVGPAPAGHAYTQGQPEGSRRAQIVGAHLLHPARPEQRVSDRVRDRLMCRLRLDSIVDNDWHIYRTVKRTIHHDYNAFQAVYTRLLAAHSPWQLHPDRIDWPALRTEAARRIKLEDTLQDAWQWHRAAHPGELPASKFSRYRALVHRQDATARRELAAPGADPDRHTDRYELRYPPDLDPADRALRAPLSEAVKRHLRQLGLEQHLEDQRLREHRPQGPGPIFEPEHGLHPVLRDMPHDRLYFPSRLDWRYPW